jgi:hypothetical protein
MLSGSTEFKEIQNAEKIDNLICKLSCEPVAAIKDTEQTLCTGFNLSREEQDRATWILQCDQIRHWVNLRQPQILLVNSNEAEHTRVLCLPLFSHFDHCHRTLWVFDRSQMVLWTPHRLWPPRNSQELCRPASQQDGPRSILDERRVVLSL